MIDLLIVYDYAGWAYHNRALALVQNAPTDFRVRIAELNELQGPSTKLTASAEELSQWEKAHGDRLRSETYDQTIRHILGDQAPDILFLLCHHQLKGFYEAIRERGWHTKLVVSWNNGWPQRQKDFESLFTRADAVIINNLEYWDQSGRPEHSQYIPNGVDLKTFRVIQSIAHRVPRVLWCGSEYHRELKGYDEFILPLFERFRADGIESEALLVNSRSPEKRTPEQMAAWYNNGTVLVCASESEGTPNTALEAAACGCTLVTTPVGNMPELIRHGENGFLVERNLESLYKGVKNALTQYASLSTQLQQDLQTWGWQDRAQQFFQMFRKVTVGTPTRFVTRGIENTDDRLDLSAEVTVFVSTVGAPSFRECMEHLKRQDCNFRLEVIQNISPMSAAFQRMVDSCQTPYYVQVDEDMMLRHDAVRMLTEWILNTPDEVPLVVAWLWDMHLNRGIQGVKAFRHSIVRNYPFQDVESCEKDQLLRMQQDGYHYVKPLDTDPTEHGTWTLGTHGTHYDPQTIFERYATLEHKRCQYPDKLAWFEAYGSDFLRRFREDPSELNLMALLGLLAGRIASSSHRGEKDFTRYNSLPGLREAHLFFEACSGAAQCQSPSEHEQQEAGIVRVTRELLGTDIDQSKAHSLGAIELTAHHETEVTFNDRERVRP